MEINDLLMEIVDVVAHNEPVSSGELPSLLADREIDVEIDADRASDLLTTAEKRELVLEVNGSFWVMRKGPYSYENFFRERGS